MNRTLFALVAAATGLSAVPAQADTLLAQQDYDNPAYIAPGVGVVASDDIEETATAGAWNAAGWSGTYVANRSTGNPAGLSFATLSGLAPNSAVRIGSGVLGFLESWDSTDGGCCAPDYLDIFINGTLVASLTANNALGTVEDYSGATELFDGVESNFVQHFGGGDTLIDFSTASFANSFADANGNWTLAAQARGAGWQGGGDEGWGIDNWSIYGTIAQAGVPEPSTWAMMILGIGVIGGAMRRKASASLRLA